MGKKLTSEQEFKDFSRDLDSECSTIQEFLAAKTERNWAGLRDQMIQDANDLQRDIQEWPKKLIDREMFGHMDISTGLVYNAHQERLDTLKKSLQALKHECKAFDKKIESYQKSLSKGQKMLLSCRALTAQNLSVHTIHIVLSAKTAATVKAMVEQAQSLSLMDFTEVERILKIASTALETNSFSFEFKKVEAQADKLNKLVERLLQAAQRRQEYEIDINVFGDKRPEAKTYLYNLKAGLESCQRKTASASSTLLDLAKTMDIDGSLAEIEKENEEKRNLGL